MSLTRSFNGNPGDSAEPNPIDTRDLARDVALHGNDDISEETLTSALQRVRVHKCEASDDEVREAWQEAEQALLGALSRKRRDESNNRVTQSEAQR